MLTLTHLPPSISPLLGVTPPQAVGVNEGGGGESAGGSNHITRSINAMINGIATTDATVVSMKPVAA